MLSVTTRHAVGQRETQGMDTIALRDNFHGAGLFAEDEIRLLYTHYDRMIVGGITPVGAELVLDKVEECGTASILDRREMGVLNLGETASVSCSGEHYPMNRGDVLYLGRGLGAVTFGAGGKFYVVSTPAHHDYPAKLLKLTDAASVSLGSQASSNERIIYQFIHPDVMESCQLVMGYTMFSVGSVWNTMPAHVHDRRMEAYLYFDLAEDDRVFHFMGEPQETRHVVMKNEEVILSPPWSIHCGCGTGSYTFCWAMAGDNVDYKDLEMVPMSDLR